MAGCQIVCAAPLATPVWPSPPQIVLDWLGQLLRLPPTFLSPQGGTGVIQSTASEATLVALLASKARAMEGRGEGDALKLCAYCSDQAHSSGEGTAAGCAAAGKLHPRVPSLHREPSSGC